LIELTPIEQNKRNKLQLEKPLVYNKMLQFSDKLQRGESIAIIQFQYNYTCNFKCVHCSIKRFQQNEQNKPSFTIENVKKLAKEADELGLARFVITGGEPLIFKDFDDVVAALNPELFYINVDTNGWYLNTERAKYLKSIGVDRIQLSIDNLNAEEHDNFRRKPGSFKRTLKAIEAATNANLDIFIQTVVTKQRLYSDEFIKFVEYFNDKNITVFITYAKPVGSWEGNFDIMVNDTDLNYVRELEKKYNLCTHLTPAYGRDLGCIAVKGMISVTQYGDVLPCPYIHTSIGNVFKEPLKDIIQRGLNIKYFGEHVDTCLIAADRNFIDKFVVNKIYNKTLPVDCTKVFTEEDITLTPFNNASN